MKIRIKRQIRITRLSFHHPPKLRIGHSFKKSDPYKKNECIYLKVDFDENLGICIRHLLQPFLRNKKIIFKSSIASISFFCNAFIFIQTSYLILLLLHCLTNLTQFFAQMGEKQFWTNSRLLNPFLKSKKSNVFSVKF